MKITATINKIATGTATASTISAVVSDYTVAVNGLVAGGTTGQIYAKKSNADFDGEWIDNTGGGSGGGIQSVVAGSNISVDDTDPLNPIVSATVTTGPAGPQGPKGDTGSAGPAGYTPIKGVDYFDGATGAQGPKGDTGSAGATGAQGPKGDTGATGAAGPNTISASTTTAINGIIKGDGANVSASAATKSDIGLGNVDNTSDASKPISTATQTALDGKKIYHGVQSFGALTFDNSTHVLTVAAATNTYWYQGTKYTTASAITADIDTYYTIAANTQYYFYFDDVSGTLKVSTTAWDLTAVVPVATVFWNGSAGKIIDERHGYNRDLNWHKWSHTSIGCRYISGLGQTYPSVATPASIQIESGVIADEDIQTAVAQQTNGVLWALASASTWTFEDTTTPYKNNAGTVQYRRTTDYTYQNVAASDYVPMWVYAAPDTDRKIYIVPHHGTAAYNTLAQARAATPPTLNVGGMSNELKLIYGWIYKGNGAYQEGYDYRLSQPLPSGGVGGTAVKTINQQSILGTGDIYLLPDKQRMIIGATDFLTQDAHFPWYGGAISSGTTPARTGDANHPGVMAVRSAAGANSGYYWRFRTDEILLAGGEGFTVIFRPDDVSTNISFMGFHDSVTNADPVDGVYFKLAGATFSGVASSNSSATATGTTYTVSAGVWYRAELTVNSASLATFALYTCSNGTQVWTNTVTTNIPTSAGRETCCGINTVSSGSSAADMTSYDMMMVYIDRILTR